MTPCLLWPWYKDSCGYGRVRYNRRVIGVHRAAYCDARLIPLSDIAGKVVRHKCDNPACFNPEHLELGSQADNIRDMVSRGRERHPTGEDNGSAKLTWEQVNAIRKEYVKGDRSGRFSARALARKYNVGQTAVLSIVNGSTWAHE